MEKETNKIERHHFGLRTLKCGTASVLLSASLCIFGAPIVQAEEMGDMSSTQADASKSTEVLTVDEQGTEMKMEEAETTSKDESVATETVATADGKITEESEKDNKQKTISEEGVTENTEESEKDSKQQLTSEATVAPVDEKSLEGTEPASEARQKVDLEPNSTSEGTAVEDEVKEGHLRLHFKKLPSENLGSLGLWTWDDVEKPSSQNGAWPTGATSFSEAKKDEYGHYLDVPLAAEKREKIGLLINNTAGENLTGDKSVELIDPKMKEVWFDEEYKSYTYEPLAAGMVRINYLRSDQNYDRKSLWLWGDVEKPTTNWPDGVDFEKQGKYGAYVDVKLADLAKSLGFLLLDESKSGDDVKIQPNDYNFTDLKKHSQIFLKDDDPTIYTNPYFVNDVRMTGAQHISLAEIETTFTTLKDVKKEEILKNLQIKNKDNEVVPVHDLILDEATKKVTVQGEFGQEQSPYTVIYGSEQFRTGMNWQLKDSLYQYDGELGARVSENGQKVAATLWSPSADQVSLVVYDKNDQSKIVGKIAMSKGEKGTWTAELTPKNALGIMDYRGYYYHYEIKRGEESVLTLDPYAKSLAAWNSDLAETDPSYKIAKAAFVDPKAEGPKELDYANISGFKDRKDAVIYEAHVRDFTSDKAIAKDLKSPAGTFSAFIEKLDYLKDLGVTHVQLLPILSYYYVNELKNAERMDDYASSNSNYNWGYDPQNYFSLTGMYSSDPTNPSKRIAEFKELVNEIHKRGMGVIMDVVYNHTAKTAIFEDLEPNYYHFMDADGTPRTSYGGGRLGTTHYMSRRVLVDSIKYLTDEFKVDGFRFDLMGDHDAATIQKAYDEAKKLNPNLIMLGEGWSTYSGDENKPVQPADQSWMKHTNSAAVFSDDIRNTLKSGYPNEGAPAFITNGKRNIGNIFKNIKAQPTNFEADDPGDVIQYIAAHDNLTLFDVIAQSIKKDPAKAENTAEIHRRLRLGNLMVLTAQGTPFIHSGQEYGRTKQFLHPAYRTPVSDDKVPNKSHLLTNEDGSPFDYPYFIHDSYDSSDAVNHFDWSKATDSVTYPENAKSRAYMKGLIALRKSTDAFKLPSREEVEKRVSLLTVPGKDGVAEEDLVLGYQTVASNGDIYLVFVNADTKERQFTVGQSLTAAKVLADGKQAGTEAILAPEGVSLTEHSLTLAPLTATILRITREEGMPAIKEQAVKGSVIVEYRDMNNRVLKDNALVHYNVAPGTTYNADTSAHKVQTLVGYNGKTYRLASAGQYNVGGVDKMGHLVSSAPVSGTVEGNKTLIVTYVYQEVVSPADVAPAKHPQVELQPHQEPKPSVEVANRLKADKPANTASTVGSSMSKEEVPVHTESMASSTNPKANKPAITAPTINTSIPRMEDSSMPKETIVSAMSQGSDKEDEKILPKTGSHQSVAGILLGVVSLVSSLVFLGKKKGSHD
ncbi:pullulanase [Streptococcus sp. ZJ93]